MKKERVECTNCTNFVKGILEDETNMLSKFKVKPKCKLGERLIFRMPKTLFDDDWGYIRKCNKFNKN